MGAAKPNIYKAIGVFQAEEVAAKFKYEQAFAGEKTSQKIKLDKDKDGKLKIYKYLLVKHSITLEVYISNILLMYTFPAPKK